MCQLLFVSHLFFGKKDMARVLIVDNLADSARLLAQEVEAQGYEVLTALGGPQALGIASAEHPDVILLDIAMPDMDGIEVCRRLQEDAHTRTIPIILVTETGPDENVIAGLHAGAVDYVSEPFNRHVLSARIRSALRVMESYEAVARTNQMLREEIVYRKETEDKAARFGRILECSLHEIYIFDAATYRFIQVNRGARENLGYSMDELRTLTPLDLKPQFTRESFERLVRPLLSGEQETLEFETVHQRKDGSTYPVDVHLQLTEYGPSRAFVAMILDATGRKLAEEALRKKDEELRQALKIEAVGRLAGGIAHEFNNLLQAISGYARLALVGVPPDEKPHQDLQQILKATDRATCLTRQLLDFSRHQQPDRKPVDPREVANDVADMVRPIIGERVTLETALDDSADWVCADVGQLSQVLVNLCLNARDAMPSGGRLTIGTNNVVVRGDNQWKYGDLPPGRYVLVSVTDTGCGMSVEVRERAFDPFFTTKEVGEGTGLGLATVYGIVQQHDGAILVESELGKGTSLRILLPAAEVEHQTQRPEPQEMAVLDGTETILMAEDEPLVRDIAVRILQSAGYSTITAANGEEALQLFEENRESISLVLLDAMMPKLNGHEVYQHIRKDDREIPIVFCSGYDPETARSELVTEEKLHMIQKPFDPDVLLGAVREVLDARVLCQPASTAL